MKRTMTVDALTDNLEQVLSFVQQCGFEFDFKTETQINLSVEEIFVNIAHYAYPEKTGEAVIETELSDDPPKLKITFRDSGIPYDPLAKDDPDITLSAEKRQIGGLGIFLVKKNMDRIEYKYENGQNVLELTKNLPHS